MVISKPQRVATQSIEQPVDILQEEKESGNDSKENNYTIIEIKDEPEDNVSDKSEKESEENRNSFNNKIMREKKYGTLIDLTILTKDNCENTIDELELRFDEALEELESVEEDLEDSEDNLERQRKQYALAVDSEDEREIDSERDDVYDAEDEVTYYKKEMTDVQRKIDELDNTIKAAENECRVVKARGDSDE